MAVTSREYERLLWDNAEPQIKDPTLCPGCARKLPVGDYHDDEVVYCDFCGYWCYRSDIE